MSLRLLRTRLTRRLMVSAQLLALLLAGTALLSVPGRDVVPLEVGLWGEIAAGVVLGLLGWSCGFGWNRLRRRDEREKERWIESQALAYRAVMALLYPCVFWVLLRELRFVAWMDASPGRTFLAMGVLLITITALPVAIVAWREPDLTDE
jgi:hypothetical protein